MDFKQRIKEKGLKKGWIANQIGVSPALFSYYINNTRPMPEDVKQKLTAFLS